MGGPKAVAPTQSGADSGTLNPLLQNNPSPGPRAIFGSASQEDSGGSDQGFSKRDEKLLKDPGLAPFINPGTVNASYVGFRGPSAIHHGTVPANLGFVSLDSGEFATLDFTGNDLIRFAVTGDIEGIAMDAEGKTIYHKNQRLPQTNGNQVTLSVKKALEIIKNVVNQSGVIEAQKVIERSGRIYLSGSGLASAKNTQLGSTWDTVNGEEEQRRQLEQGVNAGFNFLDEFAAGQSNCIYDMPLLLVPLIEIELPISWPDRATELKSDNLGHYKIDPDCILLNPGLHQS